MKERKKNKITMEWVTDRESDERGEKGRKVQKEGEKTVETWKTKKKEHIKKRETVK